MYQLYCRVYQFMFRIVSIFLPWRTPTLLEGEHSYENLFNILKGKNINNILIVTDKGIRSIGLLDTLLDISEANKINYFVYDKTNANPTIDNIEEARGIYKDNGCNAIIAFGGGSPIDCAKGVAARLAKPNKKISKMKGVLKVRKKTPLLVAIPTTSGTGSEATIAAVITNSKTHEKYAINDFVLIPEYALLDPKLTLGLPPHITSTTGIDALTHAVEAYIGRSNTSETRELSKKAIKLIFENIQDAYNVGSNLNARDNMQKASYYAGIAFTRAYVGYVHAIAHTLGGFYNTPHGLANAVTLPYVLEYYGQAVHSKLADLANLIGISDSSVSEQENAIRFIEKIKDLNKEMNIPDKIDGILDKDINIMVDRAFKEANPLYPVPKILGKEDLRNIYQMIRG